MEPFLFSEVPNLKDYTQYKEKTGLTFDDGITTDLIYAKFFEKFEKNTETTSTNNVISCGIFFYKRRPLFCAWGYKNEEHCRAHAVLGKDDIWLPAQQGCPIKIRLQHGKETIGLQMPFRGGVRDFYFD